MHSLGFSWREVIRPWKSDHDRVAGPELLWLKSETESRLVSS